MTNLIVLDGGKFEIKAPADPLSGDSHVLVSLNKGERENWSFSSFKDASPIYQGSTFMI